MFAKSAGSKSALLSGIPILAAVGWSAPAAAQDAAAVPAAATEADPEAAETSGGVGDIIVTAQRRAEAVQDIPIAISAFSEEALSLQRIETGSELVRGVPNVNFAKGYFAGFNFQIRGVGTQLGTAAGDAGVGIHLNNVPLTVSRFFEAEFYDVERVEVLRGPQGTLYGRNATGGVVNVVTARPKRDFEGMISGEVANYESYKVKGMLNVPIGDRLSLRVAGSYLKRDGFGINTFTGNNVNGRDLWSARATLLAEPVEGMEVSLMWQRFEEHDDRSRTGGMLCVKDNGPATVGAIAVTNPIIRGYLSQGCSDASIFAENSNQAPNSLGTLFGFIAQNFGLTNGDYFAGKAISRDLHDTESVLDPTYDTTNDLAILNIGMQITPSLKVTTITSYMKDHLRSTREFQGAVSNVAFNATPLTPGGFFTDPQLGRANRLATGDILTQDSKQISQEVRVDSSFDGRFNFSVGGIYVNYETVLQNYVLSNTFTYLAQFLNTNVFGQPNCALNSACIYIDPNADPFYGQNLGHNYFVSSSPYELHSLAAFGEVYFKLTDRLKLTLGGRYTHDTKRQLVLPVRLLTLGSGQAVGPVPLVKIDFKEPTGRVAIDWKPDLGFTDETLIYAVASRGYKGGGTNPPPSFTPLPPYAPEFVNALEIGTKNTLFNGAMTLNLAAFHYDYKDYQVTEIRNRTQEIQNIDAKVKGLELESVFEPFENLRLNLTAGYLDSKITRGSFVDPTNFTNKDPTVTLVRGGNASTCFVNTAALATYLATNPTPSAFVNSVCAGLVPGLVPNVNGNPTDLRGNELPNAPRWTLSAGAQYTLEISGDWKATLRGDYYWQDNSFARTYNTVGDQLRAYDNVNATLTIENDHLGWQAQLFVKNLFDTQPVVNTFVLDQIIGVARIGFVTDPRVVGVALTKRFGR